MSADRWKPANARWNGYLDSEIADDFANHGAEASYSCWGRTRNTLALSHSTRGGAGPIMMKGMASSGGNLTIAASHTPPRADVQGISVTDERPVRTNGGSAFASRFE